jgi:hypothetical protein
MALSRFGWLEIPLGLEIGCCCCCCCCCDAGVETGVFVGGGAETGVGLGAGVDMGLGVGAGVGVAAEFDADRSVLFAGLSSTFLRGISFSF